MEKHPPMIIFKLRWRPLLTLLGVLVASALAYPAWHHLYPVTAAKGWDYKVFLLGIPKVSALALDAQGALFVSQEFPEPLGKILLMQADGSSTEVLEGLSKPDGHVVFRGGLVTGQEDGLQPVLWLRDGQREVLFEADSIEGIATDGHSLFAIEDKPQGRLLRYDPETRQLSVLRDGLDEGEGVSVCPDGRLFYTEKAKGWVKQWQPVGADKLVVEGLNAPGYVQCTRDGLWITEDATHMARLLLLDSTGHLQVILQHLRAAQTIIPLGSGSYLLAEQGRSRILEISRQPNGS
ncbi:hypothetical protein [Pseudomonas sp. SJZ079]|uniref:hypothetical protein n=1 Tax=Pseudomonas sp. SJZ079 TaxID=2572887 RepID=UPI0021159686|nr:hypothetical protein [Pseudomonas sp. SJZ079]